MPEVCLWIHNWLVSEKACLPKAELTLEAYRIWACAGGGWGWVVFWIQDASKVPMLVNSRGPWHSFSNALSSLGHVRALHNIMTGSLAELAALSAHPDRPMLLQCCVIYFYACIFASKRIFKKMISALNKMLDDSLVWMPQTKRQCMKCQWLLCLQVGFGVGRHLIVKVFLYWHSVPVIA